MSFRNDLEPGSRAARGEGCICDPQPEAKQPLVVEKNCPIHGLAELKALLKGGDDA